LVEQVDDLKGGNVSGRALSLQEFLTSKGITSDNKDIGRLLVESLDDVLVDLLGKQVRDAFYDYMERTYYIGRANVPERLGDILLILERTFGKGGKTIERAMAKRLCAKLG
jgi:hypothetical protein